MPAYRYDMAQGSNNDKDEREGERIRPAGHGVSHDQVLNKVVCGQARL